MVQEYVDIITFYNQIFVPSVKPLLVEIQTNGVNAEDKNHVDGMSLCWLLFVPLLDGG